MKFVIMGQAPARSGDGRPFTGDSGKRLESLLGLRDYDALARACELDNLIDQKQLKKLTGKGDQFPRSLARLAARKKLKELDHKTVVCAGRQVWNAFGLPVEADWFEICWIKNVRFILMPHPSGISHYWNDWDNVERAKSFLRTLSAAPSPHRP